MRFRRFVVDGDSMLPTLRPGDYLLGHRAGRIAPGHIVAFEHPSRRDFWLIKRVLATSGTIDLGAGTVDGTQYDDPFREALAETGRFELAAGEVFVLSDNRQATRADSRVLGGIRALGAYRIRFRYRPRPSLF